jgi:hypothetical protein
LCAKTWGHTWQIRGWIDLSKDNLIKVIQILEEENKNLKHEREKLKQILLCKENNKFMTDRLTDEFFIRNIFESSGISYFNNDLRNLLEDIIKELCYSNQELMLKLRLNHIDRAIFKYRQAKETRCIRNTKQYFKACIISAVQETGLDELEPIEY